MANWWVNAGEFQGMPGGTTVGGGGDSSVITYRNPLDQARSSAGQLPEAQYPDGYLGTITNRREDRLLGALQKKLTDKSYQRGVHKGEKLGHDSYYWTADVNPDLGLQRQAMAVLADHEGGVTFDAPRFAPTGNPVERLAHMGKTAGLSAPEEMQMARQYGVDPAKNPLVMTDPNRAAKMRHMLPNYAR